MQTKGNSRMFAVGLKNVVHQKLLHELEKSYEVQQIESDMKGSGSEIREDDYILLFAGFDDPNQSEKTDFAGLLENFSKQLEWLGTVHPKSILLVSDTAVYGKLFGEPHPVCEDELGYVCHTAEADMSVQFLRTAEHFCSRLAREKGTPVRIARVDWKSIFDVKTETVQTLQSETVQVSAAGPHTADESAAPTGTDSEAGGITLIAAALLKVLRDGVPGEAYNLSGAVQTDAAGSAWQAHAVRSLSPLAPIQTIPDTRKAELLS